MADLWPLALGLGLMPLAAVLLYAFAPQIASRQEAAWGIIIGVLAFLGLSHAMADVLFSHSPLAFAAGVEAALGLVAIGFLVGFAAGWWFLARETTSPIPWRSWVAWTGVAFLALHSLSDGFALGRQYTGPVILGLDVDAVTFAGSVIHRFAEGSLVVIPAIAASWKPSKSFWTLFTGAMVVPAAFLPQLIFQAMSTSEASTASLAVFSLVSSAEAGLALMFLLAGFLPQVVHSRNMRWIAWVGFGFLALYLVHGLVE